MRNIVQYPITEQEILTTLQNAQTAYEEKMTFGGVDGLVLAQLIDYLKADNNLQKVLDFTKNKV